MGPGTRLTLTAERPVAGGRMLARHDGRVVLVAGAIPDERVIARVDRVARGTVFATVVEVLEPSPDRRPDAAGGCGGSVFGHVAYARQVALKAAIIEDAWHRLARRTPPGAVHVMASPGHGYRTRARLHATRHGLGFYRAGTRDWCAPAAAGQLSDASLAWIASVDPWVTHHGAGLVRAVEFVEDIAGTARACLVATAPGAALSGLDTFAPDVTGLVLAADDGLAHDDPAERMARAAGTVLRGDPAVVDQLSVRGDGAPALTLRHDVRAFFQGNRFLVEPLLDEVLAHVRGDTVLDLYAGVGLFGLAWVARGGTQVTLVEGDPSSSGDLERNARDVAGDVRVDSRSIEAFLSTRRRGLDTWIVDPPRSGLSEPVRLAVLRDRPPRVVYVSCDVATLARDVRILGDSGYDVTALSGFDMFPGTAHVEAVCVLDAVSGMR